eukprot:m.17078 g.17078  ORF g.17078 m.17078 type:complete len:346 (-) comp9205_c0_seq1:133-1170(-)
MAGSKGSRKRRVLIIGAAGAVGKALARAILARRGPDSVIAVLRRTPLPCDLRQGCIQVMGVDVRDPASIDAVVAKYADTIDCVWNLAAPLSIETAVNPAVAEAVTVGGMRNLLAACERHGITKICFSDSIGSFGHGSPREGASARWLTQHPEHDPGSEYGRQKMQCRKLLADFAAKVEGGDTRWAVIPGVLHADPTWGAGTTEYALDVILSSVEGRTVTLAVPSDVPLPMIHRDDLVRALVLLMDAPKSRLQEPAGGYAIAGFSFTATELIERLRARLLPKTLSLATPPLGGVVGAAAELARAWPNSLSGDAAKRDLGFVPSHTLDSTLAEICNGHARRLQHSRL